ncbi:xanthine dehydrogenase family protein subunit M [Acuticoccus sp. I52.16.1]|uniref:FAD binding domain-containing protein n=1 Tax=Acuticoccus sp. I52.16.1 TaxID=2928472 RepID=UPI001FD29FE6|nr:FAD binding domain-containing protein [Acuticoccus sp. I52.16.1]UOM34820.1 FAD binding domain-containing protein [Acuticoccus sp. I52.16.1]
MRAAAFDYHAPHTIDEALKLLAEHGVDSRILAGGQSLVPAMTARHSRPGHVIDINRISQAERPSTSGGRLRIPPLMRHIDFSPGAIDGPLGLLLADLSRHVSSLPVRLRGTFCGALAQAEPASEWCLASVVLGAEMIARSARRGARVVPAAEFFETIMTTTLADDEMLVEVQLPILADEARHGFYEVNPRAGTYALAMALVVYDQDEDEMSNVRLGVGAVEAVPRRIREAETMLNHRPPSKRLFREVAEAVAEFVDPMSDQFADAAWRRELTRTAVARALERSLHRPVDPAERP